MDRFRLDHWTVVPDRNELLSDGGATALEPKAMELLVRLAATPGAVVSKEELLRDVWHGAHVVEHVLPKTISALRKALRDDAQAPRFIETVPRRGYMLLIHPQPLHAAPARRGFGHAFAAALLIVICALLVTSVRSEAARSTLALLPTRGANATVARDAEDALTHDLAQSACLAVTKETANADYRLESNVVDVGGSPILRTRVVRDGFYVAVSDSSARDGVVAASTDAARAVKRHICGDHECVCPPGRFR